MQAVVEIDEIAAAAQQDVLTVVDGGVGAWIDQAGGAAAQAAGSADPSGAGQRVQRTDSVTGV